MANIAYRSGGTATSGGTDTITLTKPTGTVENDILIVGLNRPYDDTGPSAPSGWTLLGEVSPGTNQGYLTVYWKLAGASEPASYDFVFYAAHEAIGGIIAIDNANTTTTILDDGGQANASSASVTAPSITPGSQPSMLVFIGAVHLYDATFTPPSGMTEALDAAYGTDWGGITFAYLRVTDASATGTKVATASTTHTNSGWLISVNEESSATVASGALSGAGSGTATTRGASSAAAPANSAASSTATASGSGSSVSDANSQGISTATGASASSSTSLLSANGTASGVTEGLSAASAEANSTGDSTADSASESAASVVASASGVSSADAVGDSVSATEYAASSSGLSTAESVGASESTGEMSSAGAAVATAVGADATAVTSHNGPRGRAIAAKQRKKQQAQDRQNLAAQDEADLAVIKLAFEQALAEYLKIAA